MEKIAKAANTGLDLDILEKHVRLDVSVNELRIIVGCFRAITYQMETDDEPYLDIDGIGLKKRLEHLYKKSLEKEAGKGRKDRTSGESGS